MADHEQQERNAIKILRTISISIRVMWRFVELSPNHPTKDAFRQWWHLRNQGKRQTGQRIYWRHQRAGDTNPLLWSISVLCSAIIHSNLETTDEVEGALRFLSNTPRKHRVSNDEYQAFRGALEEKYNTLAPNNAQPFLDDLAAIDEEELPVDMGPPELSQIGDGEPLEVDVIYELYESLQPVAHRWRIFAERLELNGAVLNAIPQNLSCERKLQKVLGFLMGTITKQNINGALEGLEGIGDFAAEWEGEYIQGNN